jgi:hypothetical protein
MMFEQYWVFALICMVVALVILRLILRERLMLQGSMSYLAVLAIFGLMGLFPGFTRQLATAVGFTLVSNFLFTVALGLLALLHLRALVTISKISMLAVRLTQELAILTERLERELATRKDEPGP